MSSGRVHMKFSAEISQANAQIGKLNAALRRQQREIQKLKGQSKETAGSQNTMMVNLTRNISAAALAYQAVNKALALGNQLLDKRNQLQKGALDPAVRIGESMSRMIYQLGDISDKQADDLITFIRKEAVRAKVSPEAAFDYAGAVATSLGGDPSLADPEAYLKRIRGVTRAGLPLARSYKGEQVGVLIGGLTTMGYTPEEARAQMIATQKAVHSIDLASQSYIMRSLVAGKMFNMGQFQDLPQERKKQIAQEMMAVTAGFTQFMKSKGMEMPSTAAAGAMITLYERYGEELRGKSPIEALDWMTKTGVWRELDLKDVRGESIAKPGTIDLFAGGELRKIVDKILADFINTTVEDGDRIVRRATEGVGIHREPMIYSENEARKTLESFTRSSRSGFKDLLHKEMESFENIFDKTASAQWAKWWAGWPEYMYGAAEDPEMQKIRVISRAKKLAYSREYPWRSMLMPDVPFTGALGQAGFSLSTSVFGTNRYILNQLEAGEESTLAQQLDPTEMAALMRILELIDKKAKFDAENNAEPSAVNNAAVDVKESNRNMQSAVEQTGASKQLGRHTEPD